ncbi:MAG: hypothetical protein ACRDZ4_10875 [Egibacteraceae bacterium]
MSLPYRAFETQHLTLVASTDTTVSFDPPATAIRVRNWDSANRVLVSLSPIASDSDATASRVGKAPAADIPNISTFPVRTAALHLRSAGASEVTVEAYS